MKNRKLMMAGLGVGISSIVLLTSAYTVMADTSSGYELYKSAVKQTKATKNVTADIDVSLTDNGKELLAVDATMKNESASLGSGNVTIRANGSTNAIQFFRQEQQVVVKAADSDIYNVMKPDDQMRRKWEHHENQGDSNPEAERIIDALMTNLQNDIQVGETADGGKEVSLKLSQNEISPVIQALGSVLVQNAAKHHEYAGGDQNDRHAPIFANEIKPNLPKLTQDIVVKQVEAKAEINKENFVDEQTVKVTIAGKDANGDAHELVLAVQADLSDFARTVADKVDLTGKKVEIVKHEAQGK